MRFVAAAEELGSYEVKANYRSARALFGSDMPLAAEAIAALDPARVAAALARRRRGSGSRWPAASTLCAADDLILTMRAPEGYSVEREGAHAVALDLDDRRGAARGGACAGDRPRGPERPQDGRAGGRGPDRAGAERRPGPDESGRGHRDHIAGETLAVELHLGEAALLAVAEMEYSEIAAVEGLELRIALSRAGA